MFQCVLVILLFIIAVAYIWLSSCNKNKNLPPGELISFRSSTILNFIFLIFYVCILGPSLPTLLRNVIQINNFPYIKFMEWSNIYGPIMRLKVGRQE